MIRQPYVWEPIDSKRRYARTRKTRDSISIWPAPMRCSTNQTKLSCICENVLNMIHATQSSRWPRMIRTSNRCTATLNSISSLTAACQHPIHANSIYSAPSNNDWPWCPRRLMTKLFSTKKPSAIFGKQPAPVPIFSLPKLGGRNVSTASPA